jgi:hypothetical protein
MSAFSRAARSFNPISHMRMEKRDDIALDVFCSSSRDLNSCLLCLTGRRESTNTAGITRVAYRGVWYKASSSVLLLSLAYFVLPRRLQNDATGQECCGEVLFQKEIQDADVWRCWAAQYLPSSMKHLHQNDSKRHWHRSMCRGI